MPYHKDPPLQIFQAEALPIVRLQLPAASLYLMQVSSALSWDIRVQARTSFVCRFHENKILQRIGFHLACVLLRRQHQGRCFMRGLAEVDADMIESPH